MSTKQAEKIKRNSGLRVFNKEIIGFENLIFRSLNQRILLLVPFITTIITFSLQPISYTSDAHLISKTSLRMEQSLVAAILSVIFLVAYLGGYKMHQIQNEGKYGYWLALGMERRKFYIVSNLALSFYSFISIFLAILVLMFFSGLLISPIVILKLLLLIYGTTIIITVTISLISELVTNSELAFLSSIFIFGLILFFSNDDLILKQIVFSMNFVYDKYWILYLMLQIVASAIILFISYKLHDEKDIELGG